MQLPWCLLCDRHRAGGLDEVVRGGGGGVVEEGLRGGGEGSVGLRHEDKGTLDGVAAVEDGLLGASDAAADRHSLDGVLALDCGEGGVPTVIVPVTNEQNKSDSLNEDRSHRYLNAFA